jgi:hypothetical protein
VNLLVYVPMDCECKYRQKFLSVKLLNLIVNREQMLEKEGCAIKECANIARDQDHVLLP